MTVILGGLGTTLKTSMTKLPYRSMSFHKIKNWYASLGPLRPSDPPYTHIAQIGDPILRSKCDPVPPGMVNTEEMTNLINQMQYVLRRYNSCGLSAPQIGVPLQVFVMEFDSNRRKEFAEDIYKSRKMCDVPFSVFINPVMRICNFNKIIYPEACESVKGYSADVSRYSEVEIQGLNEMGENIVVKADGWTARIIQHEMDHLQGRIYTDVMDKETFSCTCWKEVNDRRGKIEIPFSPN